MNCQEFWDTMPELAPRHSDHIHECPRCAALLAQQAELVRGLRAAAAASRDIEAPARLEARLLTAFRSYNGITVKPRRTWVGAFAWAAAVAAVIALAFVLARPNQPQTRPAQHRSNGIEFAAMQTVDPQAENAIYEENGFLPLPSVARLDANEDVNLVRVELPRSAMIAVGYTVSADRASEPVEAEVALGPDGLAHAVRFLDE